MVCCIDIGLAFWVARDAEVVVEFQRNLASALQLFLVEVVDLSVRLDDVVDRFAVVGVQQRLIVCIPYWYAISIVSHHDLRIVHECIRECLVLVTTIDVANLSGLLCGRQV